MGTSISAGTIMAYMDLDMSSFNSAIDMAGEQLSGFASGGVAGALGSIGAAATRPSTHAAALSPARSSARRRKRQDAR